MLFLSSLNDLSMIDINDINNWMELYRKAIFEAFGGRVLFIGLQGSYARGEAKGSSDIDPVLILDRVTSQDLTLYREAASALPHSDLLCGFVSGRAEISGWVSGELFQFYYDTIPHYGSLDHLIKRPGVPEAWDAVRSGACAIYHGCSHNMLHSRDVVMLKSLYKSAVFIVQALYFLEHGRYIHRHRELAGLASGDEQHIVTLSLSQDEITAESLDELSSLLLSWSSRLISKYPL